MEITGAPGALLCTATKTALTVIFGLGLPLNILGKTFARTAEGSSFHFAPAIFLSDLKHDARYAKHPLRLKTKWEQVIIIPIPVMLEDGSVHLILGGNGFDPTLKDRMAGALRLIGRALADQVVIGVAISGKAIDFWSSSESEDQFTADVVLHLPVATIVLDQNLVIRMVSEPAKREAFPREPAVGLPLKDLFGCNPDALAPLKSLLDGQSAPVCLTLTDRNHGIWRVDATAFGREREDRLLALIFRRETSTSGEGRVAEDRAVFSTQPPTVVYDFLSATLVNQRRLHHRGKFAYHSVRRWRAAIKPFQISALRALKAHVDPSFVQPIADELATAAVALFGRRAIEAVTNVPCGASGPGCLAEHLGRTVAAVLSVPYRRTFAPLNVKGSSHPAKNAQRPRMKLLEAHAETILVVDDVVTSGAHLEEACRMLDDAGANPLALAWVSG